MMEPLVSVVIPNYNRAKLLPDAVSSIQKQTYRPIEVIIVDDHSIDGSQEVIKHLANTQTNIRYQLLPENHGANHCRNTGVSMAQGEYIAFLDSDDTFLPEKIEKQMSILSADADIGFVVTGFGDTNIQGVMEGSIPLKKIVKENSIGGFSTLLVRKNLFLIAGSLDESLPSCQDWDLYLRLLQLTKGYKIREQLYTYKEQADSISKNTKKVIDGYLIVSQRAAELNKKYHFYEEKELAGFQEYYLGMRYFKLKDIHSARNHLSRSLKIKFSLVPCVYYCLSLFGYSSLNIFLNIKISVTRIIRKIASKRKTTLKSYHSHVKHDG